MYGRLYILPLILLLGLPQEAQARSTGRVSINAGLSGAAIWVDGRRKGKTPAVIDLSPGWHTIRIKKLGYLEVTERVAVKARRLVKLTVNLLPFAGVLNIKANVSGAKVFVDGKSVGSTPLVRELAVGRRRIEVRARRHLTYKKTIDSRPGKTYKLNVSLRKGRDDVVADLGLVALPGDDGGLALAPLPPSDASLDLVPMPGNDGGLALAPLPPPPGKTKKKKKSAESLELVDLPLAPLPPTKAKKAKKKTAQAKAPRREKKPSWTWKESRLNRALSTTVEFLDPPGPWYMKRWVWGTGAIVATTSVLLTAKAIGGGEEESNIVHDAEWQLGGSGISLGSSD
ncbi:MAG: PEGA domain-containing protein [Myxococcota bacterium]|jgi:hypothetical protein|nr:PEGA domain-containing protein [Myxococcota bacterium]